MLAHKSWERKALKIDNPYETVDWDSVQYVHSVSHQHAQAADLETLWAMGIRHFPISNYYPSKPFYPLPENFVQAHPQALGAPNAEQHACVDNAAHWNSLGSFYSTGSRHIAEITGKISPIEYVFSDLNRFDPDHEPWRGIYRTDIRFTHAGANEAPILLSVDGALEINLQTGATVGDGVIAKRPVLPRKPLFLRIVAKTVLVRLEFDQRLTKISALHLVQGTHRPWRDAFRAALDGTLKDAEGNPVEGLQHPDGGGITINHPPYARNIPDSEPVDPPYSRFKCYLEMLDFDSRVLGIEIWNAHEGFGRKDTLGFHLLWDDILRTGRRCLGFFAKDHFYSRTGRNVLLMPALPNAPQSERERLALQLYRQGAFFGLLGAVATDAEGSEVLPFDHSEFRFVLIKLVRDANNLPEALDVAVTGADECLRPNLQIRFITDLGTALVVDGKKSARFQLPRNGSGKLACGFVRVEAFAYPNRLANGECLDKERIGAMNVREIARLHDRLDKLAGRPAPLPVVDMIFTQPIRFTEGE